MVSLLDKTIDNYRILEEIGQGGMGIVYKAMDVALEKIVAIKMMNPVLLRDEAFVQRFRKEAKALAKLKDDNIVDIYALRETEFGLMIVMEYVDAVTLADKLESANAMPYQTALPIFTQLLDAIGHAHRAGIVHRDIKPRNVLITKDDKIKMTDFGLAKIQKGGDSTVSSATGGTLYYMSPEQVDGKQEIDHRSDIYSLGMTLYEMLAGSTPFQKADSDFTVRRIIMEGKLAPPHRLNPQIPTELAKIITKAISRKPEKRYQTVGEMRHAIEGFERLHQPTSPVAESQSKEHTLPLDEYNKIHQQPKMKKRTAFTLNKVPKPAIAAGGILLLALLVGVFFKQINSGFSNFTNWATAVSVSDTDGQSIPDNSQPRPNTPKPISNIDSVSHSQIIMELTKISDTSDLQKKLTEYQRDLLISIGKRENFEGPEGCYIFVVDHQKVLAALQYRGGFFYNLNTGEVIRKLSDRYSRKASIWIRDHSNAIARDRL